MSVKAPVLSMEREYVIQMSVPNGKKKKIYTAFTIICEVKLMALCALSKR
jgi:hypothetical protein